MPKKKVPKGPSPFMFVEVTHTGKVSDKTTRTAMHRHVMWEIGRSRKRRTRTQDPQDDTTNLSMLLEPPPIPERDRITSIVATHTSLAEIPRPLLGGGRLDPFISYPIDMGLDELSLINFMYSHPDPHLIPLRNSWLPVSLADPAFFYEILSHVAVRAANLYPDITNSKQSIIYHARAVQLVNKQLADPILGTSDGMVGTVLAFTCFSHSSKDWSSYNMHMKGLQTMISVRGGVQSLEHNRVLRLILSGIDVVSSCFKNIQRRFPLPLLALSEVRKNSQDAPWCIPIDAMATLWQHTFPSDLILSEIFSDLCTTIMLIRSEGDRKSLWQNTYFGLHRIDPLTDRLLASTVTLPDIGPTNFVNECCRLSALLFLSKIRRKFGAPLVYTGIGVQKLKKILEGYYDLWIAFKPCLLWVLLIGAMESSANVDRAWFAGLVSQTAWEMGLAEWGDILAVSTNLLWVNEVLDAECDLIRPLITFSNPVVLHHV